MKHLKLFENIKQYESYKNGSNYVLPNVSYVKETKGITYEAKKAYTLRAKYNATPDNLVAFTGATNIKSLNVNGAPIKVEPIKNEITTFDVLGENISINMETGEAILPESYWIKSPVSSWSFKAKDPNYTINENTYVWMLGLMGGDTMVEPIPFEEAVGLAFTTSDGVTIEIIDTFLDQMSPQIQSGLQICFTLSDMDANSGTFTFIDTEHQTNVTTGGMSTYSFDSEGSYDVKIELVDPKIKMIFTATPLTSIEISNAITSIGDYAFYYCTSLTSVTIPESVTTIGEEAFCECRSLTSVTIGNGVTTIGYGAFRYCSRLTSVYISDIAAWCNISFNDVDSNPLSYANNLYLNNELVTDLTIPDSVETIGYSAFRNCTNLTSVTIGNGVTSIRGEAFIGCNSLESVTIGDSVTEIGDEAFGYCDSLTSITIPDSVTTIGGGAFNGCDNLVEFKGKFASEDGRCLIVDGVLNSFAPVGLTEYTIPDGVTTIGKRVFRQCSSLTSVIIPDSVTTIGWDAFEECRSLTSITIPDSVTTIGDWAFGWCTNLTSVYCKPTTPPTLDGTWDTFVFYNIGSKYKIYVPEGSVEAYKSAKWWSKYKSSIVGYNF